MPSITFYTFHSKQSQYICTVSRDIPIGLMEKKKSPDIHLKTLHLLTMIPHSELSGDVCPVKLSARVIWYM